MSRAREPHEPWRDQLPDVRDGLTRKERIVLWVLSTTQTERHGLRRIRGTVPTAQLYGRVLEFPGSAEGGTGVCEYVDMSVDELQRILQRLGALRVLPR